MNIIFTDIDGVLNPHWRKKWSKSCIEIYNKLCNEYNLKPVITSTWRIAHDVNKLQNIFDEQGITIKIYDYTPLIDQADRGIEIKKWLENNAYDNYVVIDDRVFDITPHVENVIQCRSWLGLTNDEYLQIKNIFK